jgi:hypothetical protein
VPDSSGRRALIFLLLFVYHGAHSLSKTFAMALLAQVSWLALIVYTVADHVAFQLLKLACNDFIYWAPGVGGIVSLLARFCAKAVADFTGTLCISRHIETAIRLVCAWVTGLVHFRHPCELGGAYYLFTTIMNQLSVFVAAFIYWQYHIPPTATVNILRGVVLNATATNSSAFNLSLANLANAFVADSIVSTANDTLANATQVSLTDGKIVLTGITLVASVGTLFAMWAFAALGLWLTMKPEYRRTFRSTQTGYAYSQSIFLCNEGKDAKRIEIFSMNDRHWRAIRDRVRQWVLTMYAAWQVLKPVWFTDAVKAQIPDAFIPTDALRQENARARRRRQTVGRLSFALRAEADANRTSVVGAPSLQPIGSEEDDGAAQPKQQTPDGSSAVAERSKPVEGHRGNLGIGGDKHADRDAA